jgi:hypothetical protein
MGFRKHDDSFASPILSNTKAARTLGGVLIGVGVIGIPFQLSGAGAVFFVFAGIGIILLSTSNDAMHLAALGSFGIALFSLGLALG